MGLYEFKHYPTSTKPIKGIVAIELDVCNCVSTKPIGTRPTSPRLYLAHRFDVGVRAMFIAQAYGIELTITEQIIGVLTGLLASIGAAGIPMAGLVMISVVLSAMGLPLEGVGLILAVDRILDMFRTTVNVWSDSCGAVIIAKSEGEKLKV